MWRKNIAMPFARQQSWRLTYRHSSPLLHTHTAHVRQSAFTSSPNASLPAFRKIFSIMSLIWIYPSKSHGNHSRTVTMASPVAREAGISGEAFVKDRHYGCGRSRICWQSCSWACEGHCPYFNHTVQVCCIAIRRPLKDSEMAFRIVKRSDYHPWLAM